MLLVPAADAGPFSRRQAAPAQPVYQPAQAAAPAYAAPADPPLVYQPSYYAPAASAQSAVPHPILAKFALIEGPWGVPGAPPPPWEGGFRAAPVANAYRFTMLAFTFIPSPFTPIGLALPPVVRVAHVGLNGSPYPGRPLQTGIWVASPYVARIRDWIQERRCR